MRGSLKPSLRFNATPVEEPKEGFLKIAPFGDFQGHHQGGYVLDKTRADEMVKNHNTMGIDLLFDFDHSSLWGETRASGWSTALEARDDGLYVSSPEWTGPGKLAIENREYRYFSPVFDFQAEDQEGKAIGARLISVALTNTPFFEGLIDPVGNSTTMENDKMTKEQLKKLGLDENATEAEIDAALDALEAKVPVEEPGVDEPEGGEATANSRMDAIEKRLDAQDKASADEKAELLVNSAITAGKILPADKDVYINSAKLDYEATKTKLDGLKANSAMPGKVTTPTGEETEVKVNSTKAAAEYFKTAGRAPIGKGN
ncbi:MAG: hypothetical protein H8E26_14160 [FCB group bacterium]|nr:hypothetical protein [FCB group bacterium]